MLGPPIIIGFVKGIFSSATGSRSSSRSSSYYEQEEEEEREAEAQPTAEAKPVESAKIYMPQKASAFKGESYEDVVKILEGAGFHNIKLVADPDLINGFLHDDGDVEKVSVGGYTSFSTSDSFDPDVEIVITYHTFPDSKKENASSENENEGQKPTATTKPTPTAKPTPTPKPTEGQRAGTQEMNNVLYDNKGIKFVLTTYEYDSFWGTHTLNFEITNNSNHEILVTVDNVASNGYQLDVFGIYKTVGPGLKAKDSIVIYDSDLKKNGLTKLEPLSFDLEIMDMETFNVIVSGHISQ